MTNNNKLAAMLVAVVTILMPWKASAEAETGNLLAGAIPENAVLNNPEALLNIWQARTGEGIVLTNETLGNRSCFSQMLSDDKYMYQGTQQTMAGILPDKQMGFDEGTKFAILFYPSRWGNEYVDNVPQRSNMNYSLPIEIKEDGIHVLSFAAKYIGGNIEPDWSTNSDEVSFCNKANNILIVATKSIDDRKTINYREVQNDGYTTYELESVADPEGDAMPYVHKYLYNTGYKMWNSDLPEGTPAEDACVVHYTMKLKPEHKYLTFYGPLNCLVAVSSLRLSKDWPTEIGEIATEDASPRYFNMQGVEVAEPVHGIFIRVCNGHADKIVL